MEDDFKQAGGTFKEVKVSHLFDIVSGNQPNIHNRFSIKEEGMVNTITGATTRNGINFYSYSDVSYNHELTISKDGEYAGTVFLQTEPFIIGGHCMGIFAKKPMSDESKIYIAALINKVKPMWRGNDRPSVQKSRLELLKIDLPYIENDIAFSYMENYIKTLEAERIETLEAERIETLEAYLTVTGLRDYHLTRKDEQILDKFAKLSDTKSRVEESGAFCLSRIFTWGLNIKEIDPLKLGELTNLSSKPYPFYGQSTLNNGIISYPQLTEDVLNNSAGKPTILVHSNNQNIVYLETPFYLKDGHGATSVLQSDRLDRYSALYLMTVIRKVISKRFDYNAKATKIGLKTTEIYVPTLNNQPDYDFMADFIKVMEKLVIKDLVIWLDKKIAATKEVVARKN